MNTIVVKQINGGKWVFLIGVNNNECDSKLGPKIPDEAVAYYNALIDNNSLSDKSLRLTSPHVPLTLKMRSSPYFIATLEYFGDKINDTIPKMEWSIDPVELKDFHHVHGVNASGLFEIFGIPCYPDDGDDDDDNDDDDDEDDEDDPSNPIGAMKDIDEDMV